MKRKLKIFDYSWHISHQYDMAYALRNECDFFHCLNIKKQWDDAIRPKPDNITFVDCYEKGIYDLAILHVDQEVVIPTNIKKLVYQEFNEFIQDIPKIVLNHGTPVIPEYYRSIISNLSLFEMEQLCKNTMCDLVGDNLMVVNSYKAATTKEWGFGYPIIHGLNPADWLDLAKEPRAFTAISPHGLNAAVNRECVIDVSEELYRSYGHTLAFAKLNVSTGTSFDDYRTYLGSSLIYLDPSFRTPMNRARTEAFLSGCCVLQVEGAHDLERWARDGDNMLIVPNDPKKIAALLVDLIENRYQYAKEIGQRGRLMAIQEFNPDRYRDDWLRIIDLALLKYNDK